MSLGMTWFRLFGGEVAAMRCPGISGHLLTEDIDELRHAGVEAVVCLMTEDEFARRKVDPDIRAAMTKFAYTPWHPIADMKPPTPKQTNLISGFVRKFAQSKRKVAIHCAAGLGRTGTVIACLLNDDRAVAGDSAIAFVRAARPGSIQSLEQEDFIREWAKARGTTT